MFGPTLLKTTEGSASLSSLVDTVHQTRVVELLTRHADTIFGPTDSFLSSKQRKHKRHKPVNQSESDKNANSEQRKGLYLELYFLQVLERFLCQDHSLMKSRVMIMNLFLTSCFQTTLTTSTSPRITPEHQTLLPRSSNNLSRTSLDWREPTSHHR